MKEAAAPMTETTRTLYLKKQASSLMQTPLHRHSHRGSDQEPQNLENHQTVSISPQSLLTYPTVTSSFTGMQCLGVSVLQYLQKHEYLDHSSMENVYDLPWIADTSRSILENLLLWNRQPHVQQCIDLYSSMLTYIKRECLHISILRPPVRPDAVMPGDTLKALDGHRHRRHMDACPLCIISVLFKSVVHHCWWWGTHDLSLFI